MALFELIPRDSFFANQDVHDLNLHREKILLAMIGPILFGLTVKLKHEVTKDFGSINDILLRQLARSYRDNDGDCGACFEYAVHSAIRNNNPLVMERIQYALSLCGIKGNKTTSFLLGFEKAGILQISNELNNNLTPDSKLITNLYGESIAIKEYINAMINSFRKQSFRGALPTTIQGIWKADLFIGNTDSDMWVAASVKINRLDLKYSRGLCLGIVPATWNKEPACSSKGGMIVCPLLYSKSFMELFYSSWQIVTKFLKNDAKLPKEMELYHPVERKVAKYLASMRDRPVFELVDNDLRQLAHPTIVELKATKIETVDFLDKSIRRASNMTIFVPNSLRLQ